MAEILTGVIRMSEIIKNCYDRVQTLEISPTLTNMEKLLQTLYDLRSVYQKLKEMEATTDGTDNGTAADPQ